jgi:superfamily II DNA or RNA helicase
MSLEKRIRIQTEATQKIIENKFKGIVDVSFRVGKTKLTIDALNTVTKDINVLILAPGIPILSSWKEEIIKWKLNANVNVTYLWSNSIKKDNNLYHLIIADECHAYNKMVLLHLRKHQLRGTRILGLTGTLDQAAEFNLHNILSIKPIYQYTFEEAVKDKIIADYSVTCIGVDLDDELEVHVIDSARPAVSEKKAYEHWDRLYNDAVKKGRYKNLRFYMSKRKDIIYTSQTKLSTTLDVVDKHDRCLIFSARQEIADKIGDGQFHSKSKKTLEKFTKEKLNKLSVISMISMGITLPKLKVAIFNQMKSVEALALQQAARILNLEDGTDAQIFIVYLKNTQDEVWMRDAIKGFQKTKINWV